MRSIKLSLMGRQRPGRWWYTFWASPFVEDSSGQLLVTRKPMQAPPKVTVIRRQNAFLFYLFSYPVDYVLWINLSAAAKRQRRSPDGRGPLAAAKRQRIPCLSGANHPSWRGLQQPREENHACRHAGGWTTVQRNHQGVPPRYPLRELSRRRHRHSRGKHGGKF